MRRSLSVLLALTLFLAFPIGASAQSWFGGLFGSGGQDGSFESYSPSSLKFDVGYLFGDRGVRNDVTVKGDGKFFGRHCIRHEFPVQGWQLGATLQAPIKDDLGVVIRGTWLIPAQPKTLQTDDNVTSTAIREWSTEIEYYTLEAAMVYPVYSPFKFMGGLRFDSLIANFGDPVRRVDFSSSRTRDGMEHTYNVYIPYAGLAVQSGRALRVWMIGTPILRGQVKTRETVGGNRSSLEWNCSSFSSSSFVECGIDYERNLFGGTAGILAKWTSLCTKGNATFQDVTAIGVYEREPIDMSVRRQNILLAAQFSLPFRSPW